MFDLPQETDKQKKDYRNFVKTLISSGFFRFQFSIYCKMCKDVRMANAFVDYLSKNVPSEGYVVSMQVTESQFNNMKVMLGDYKCDVIDSTDVYIEL